MEFIRDNRCYKTASRWLKVHYKYVTKRHLLYDYAEGNDDCLCYFIHKGKQYALGQFMRLSFPIMWEDEQGKLQHLSGYDCTEWHNPYLIEISDGGECVRLWTESEVA